MRRRASHSPIDLADDCAGKRLGQQPMLDDGLTVDHHDDFMVVDSRLELGAVTIGARWNKIGRSDV